MFWDHWLIIVAPKPIILYPLNWVIDFKMDRFHNSFVMKTCDLFGKSHQTRRRHVEVYFLCVLLFLTSHRTSLRVFLDLARITASSSYREVLFGWCFVCFKCIFTFHPLTGTQEGQEEAAAGWGWILQRVLHVWAEPDPGVQGGKVFFITCRVLQSLLAV